MHGIVAGGTGLIGQSLIERWLKRQHTITVVGRSLPKIEKIFGSRVRALTWDALTTEVLGSADVVVNLAGTNVAEKRWSEARQELIIQSRVRPTQQLAALLVKLGAKAPLLLNASAIGIYGLQAKSHGQLPPPLTETAPIQWEHPADFLSTVATRWEQAATPAVTNGARVIFLRFGVVLAKEGGALPMLKKPFEFYLGGKVGTGQQPFSWVAIDDVMKAIDFLIAKPDASGAFNIVSPACVTQSQLAEMLSKLLDRPKLVTMPAFALELIFGKEMARELLLEGQHVYPERLLTLGYHFAYTDLESALNHILRT